MDKINKKEFTNEFVTITKKNNIVTDSLTVAKFFEKRHSNVLADINRIINSFENINSPQSWGEFYASTTYKDSSGKTNKKYIMTEKGYFLLVMGFTGQKAFEQKIKLLYKY